MDDIRTTIEFLNKVSVRKDLKRIIFSESGEVPEMSLGATDFDLVDTKENITDISGMESENYSSGHVKNEPTGQRELLDIGEFLSRPIPLTSFQVDLATDVEIALSIWDLYTLTPSIRSKLRNYAYLRGDLHIRIAVSGTPFHYGRLLVSYQPFPDSNYPLQSLLTSYANVPGLRPLVMNYLSQSPGSFSIDVHTNQPVELECPYIGAKPMFRLYNSSATAIGASTSYDDCANAGDLMIYTLNQLGCVAASPSDVSVYVYAWMEIVELGTSTGTQVAITTESADEREVGVVEKIASRAASALNFASRAPYIGPYAKASAMIAQGVASVAALFGWSKPIMVDEPMIVKNVPYQNGAYMIGYDTNYRVVLDPKQELTIDPTVTGSSEDEMAFSHINSRSSYLTTFSWNDDSPVMQSPIWVCAVHPLLETYYDNTTELFRQPTAMSFAALPFRYWRGIIKFKFEIVASQYHRGKLAIFFEPNIIQNVIINAALSTNKQYMLVVDIQETQSFEICVNWAFPRAWAQLGNNASVVQSYGADFDMTSMTRYMNGYIGVTPLTTLQSPDDSDVSVNIYVSSDDMHYNFLDGGALPQERTVITESSHDSSNIPTGITCFDLNRSSADESKISEIHFGEEPFSFRALLKRYVTTGRLSISTASSTENTIVMVQNIVPEIFPNYGNTSVAIQERNLFSYLRYAYLGLRGGIRKRLFVFGPRFDSNQLQAKVSLAPSNNVITPSVSVITLPPEAILRGTVTFVPSTNAGIEVELPFYSNNLFAFSFCDSLNGVSSDLDVFWPKGYEFAIENIAAIPDGFIDEESAAADDFCFLRFQGAPYFTIGA
jgi:hypothetical protein